MFGVVPKVLWGNAVSFDEQNRIFLATRSLLAVNRRERRVVLVDTGCGTKWKPGAAERFAIVHHPHAISTALAAFALSALDVTDVVVTHLHFDHNGGLTEWKREPGGPTGLAYPRARHWIHRKQWDHAQRPHAKDRASYLREDFEALASAGVLQMVEGDQPPPPMEGVEWFLSHGHTPYQLFPLFRAGDDQMIFVGDMVPTVAHLRPTWVMAYDMVPTRTIEEKEIMYRRCLDEGLRIALPHDPNVAAVRIDGTIDRPIVANRIDA